MSEAINLDDFTVPGFDGVKWQKSSRSNQQHLDDCVAVAELPGGAVAIADTKHPENGAHTYSASEFGTFLASVKDGEFDHLVA